MDIFLSVIVIVVLVGLFFFIRSRNTTENVRPDEKRKTPVKPTTKFHAVSIKFARDACQAAKDMEGRRFLSSAAPRIPLPGCDVLECKCKFVHHKDRRTGDDRRDPYAKGFGKDSTGTFEKEQRKRGDRRSDDPDDYFG